MASDKRKLAVEGMKATRAKADRLLDRTAIAPVRKTFNMEYVDVVRGLSGMFRGKIRSDATPSQRAQILSFLTQRIPRMGASLGKTLISLTKMTIEEGFDAVAALVRMVEKSRTPLDDIASLGEVVNRRLVEINALRQRSANALAGNVHVRMADVIRSFSTKGSRVSDMINAVEFKLEGEWWEVERTARTEASFAYNLSQADAIKKLAASPEFRNKLFSRWTELIDDLTGEPFDDRVAEDSKRLHGQITKPGGVFTMPGGGGSWRHPPNRPNDRAVLTPWQRDWGIPGWMLRSGRRIRLGT